MLIETPYKNGDTVSIKLTSGEELVGRLDEDKGTTIVLRKPLMVAGTPQGLGLAPFMFTVDQDSKVTIDLSKIVCIVKTQDDFARQYVANTSGIQI